MNKPILHTGAFRPMGVGSRGKGGSHCTTFENPLDFQTWYKYSR